MIDERADQARFECDGEKAVRRRRERVSPRRMLGIFRLAHDEMELHAIVFYMRYLAWANGKRD
jgi:hypothetical protein